MDPVDPGIHLYGKWRSLNIGTGIFAGSIQPGKAQVPSDLYLNWTHGEEIVVGGHEGFPGIGNKENREGRFLPGGRSAWTMRSLPKGGRVMGMQGWIVLGLVGIALGFLLRRFAGRRSPAGCGCATGSGCTRNKRKR